MVLHSKEFHEKDFFSKGPERGAKTLLAAVVDLLALFKSPVDGPNLEKLETQYLHRPRRTSYHGEE